MISANFLVIGSGLAGLNYALKMAEHGEVAVLCKGLVTEGNTLYAQGGIASVSSPDDSFQSHIQDTLDCGAGICHEDIVRLVIENAPASVKRLTDLGAKFDLTNTQDPQFQLAREGGHSARRVLHAGDSTGAEIQRAITEQALNHPRIKIYQEHIAIDFIKSDSADNKEITGVYALDKNSGEIRTFGAQLTFLASGGVGKVYLYTSNPDVATGDGLAMAYRAGAVIGNMEFIQFHPTCLYHPQAKSFLLTEALRGEGAHLLTAQGERFMHRYHPQLELAPRDVVARAIDDVMKQSGDECVYLDISFKDPQFILERFPRIAARTKELGFDICSQALPVVPAAHYCCGGVLTDSWGQTNLPRLLAAGEVACTGLHGANRLASNSLLEALVFSERAAIKSLELMAKLPYPSKLKEWDYLNTVSSKEEVLVSYFWDEVRRLMWNLVGIVRSEKRLQMALSRLQLIKQDVRDYYWKFKVTSDFIELRNIIQVAEIIISSAISRQESRGLHYTLDFPATDNEHFKKDTLIKLNSQGELSYV